MAKTTTPTPVSRGTLIRKAKSKTSAAAAPKATAKAPRSGKAKVAPTPEAAPQPRVHPRHREALEQAEKGILPLAPDFSAATHKPYRKRLAALVALAEAGDLAALEAVEMLPPRSTSPKALHRYRDLAMTALRARAVCHSL